MKIIQRSDLLLVMLMCSIALADPKTPPPPAKPLPDSMPLKAAKDLDYAIYTHQRKALKLAEKYKKLFEEELKTATTEEDALIADLSKRYGLKLMGKVGELVDTVDPDTGKIERGKVKAQ